MKLLVGLGNPGNDYKISRHNSGFIVLDEIAREMKLSIQKEKFNSFYFKNDKFILLKPYNFINNSGDCVLKFINYYNIEKENVLVIYDDIHLPLSNFRFRISGSSGGHNGIKDILCKLNTEKIKRIKIGVGYDNNFFIKDWVLKNFNSFELDVINKKLKKNINSIINWLNDKKNDFINLVD